jgi:hypothetical protein
MTYFEIAYYILIIFIVTIIVNIFNNNKNNENYDNVDDNIDYNIIDTYNPYHYLKPIKYKPQWKFGWGNYYIL